MFRKKRIYLDYASSTPIDSRVERVMVRTGKSYGNPSAIHTEGVSSRRLIDLAKKEIGLLAQVRSEEVFFTASGTESNNTVIKGIVDSYTGEGLPHIVTTRIEHPSVLEVCRKLQKENKAEVSFIGVDGLGVVSPKAIQESLKENTVLVSVMQANNETGVIQPISQISRVVREYRKSKGTSFPYVHTDASQCPCYLDFRLDSLGADVVTLDGLKVYGPRGIGVILKKSTVLVTPLVLGGGQEKGLRSGTENVPAISGLAEALKIADSERESEVARLKNLRDYCIKEILENFPESSLNGTDKERLPNNINICFPRIDAEFLVIQLDALGIAVSYSSSCRTKAENSSSYVIEELGKEGCATSSLRVTLGRFTSKNDVKIFLKKLQKAISTITRK